MGVVIKATGASNATDTASIVAHAARAARSAMDTASIVPAQVGVLINTCVYRDSNTMEPAIGALIQKEAGIGLEYDVHDPRSFSFDLMNGACGALNAVQVATALLTTGSTEHVLIVSGDTHPSMTGADAPADYPYGTAGAALILEKTDAADGFGPVFTELAEGSSAVEGFVDGETIGTNGRNMMNVEREEGFEDRLLDTALTAAGAALEGTDIDLASTLLIASTPTPGFPARLAAKLGVVAPEGNLLEAFDRDPHTATLTLTYHRAAELGLLGKYTNLLFVAAGSGPSAAAAVYRLPVGVGSA